MKHIGIMLLMTLMSLPALADTYYIREGGSGAGDGRSPETAFATLDQFAAIAQAGDVVYIGAGEYAGQSSLNRDGSEDSPIRIFGDVTGVHTGDAGRVVLSNNSSSHILQISGADHVYLENLDFDGGQDAIRIDASTGVEILNCRFTDARESAVSIMNNGSVTISNCDIESRKRGVYVVNGDAIITDSSMHDLSDALQIQNSGSSIEARRVDIRRVGRGAHTQNGTLTLINVLVDDTSNEGVLTKNQTTLVMVHCTINDTQKQGAKFGGNSTLHNNIFSNIGSHCMQLDGGQVTASHNLVYKRRGNRSNRFDSLVFEFDPKYTDADRGDFSLQSGSEAKDIGMDASSFTSYDLGRADRPTGGGFDLGAYEQVFEGGTQRVRFVQWREVGAEQGR